ncbi:MAG: energy-coupling factor transporter transmembrane component T [Methanomicrobiales archaeon]|nr:energy-coupling factor transporter transmembrane component T [Methanomicrobiales archaeon]MDI6876890.1 energy-coupling factor transporter transmembrane component T [Methanomicrobiales archaeon]
MAEILQYVHRDGFLHRLNPLTKILCILAIGASTVLSDQPLLLSAIILGLILVAWKGRILNEILRQTALIAAMSAILIAIAILTVPHGTVLGTLIPQPVPLIGGAIPITLGALGIGSLITLRFMVLITLFQLFVISTQPRDLVHALEWMRVPPEYTLMFVLALRFIPSLQREAIRIHEAQLARGYNPGGGLFGRIRSLAPLMIPLVAHSLGKATVLGLTIDLRGYRRYRPVRKLRFSAADIAAVSGVGLGGIALCWCIFPI